MLILAASAAVAAGEAVKAPMPGTVVQVATSKGASVNTDDLLVVIN